MLQKTGSIALRERIKVKAERLIYEERRAWERRTAKGKHWQEEFT